MPVRVQVENFGDEKGIRYQLLKKSYNYSMHMHQFSELFIVLEGEVEITVDGRCESIKPNQAAFVFPFQSHEYKSNTLNRVAIFVFSEALVPELSLLRDGRVGERSVFDLSESAIHSLSDRIINSETYEIFDLKGCLYLSIQDFIRQVNLRSAPRSVRLPAEKIIKYIVDHMTESISLETVAADLGYSPKYLSNCINRLFDMNFATLVANARVDRARHLLRETNKTRTEICYECGFSSERSFHRQFQKIMNYTPTQYRGLNLGKVAQGTIRRF